MNNQTFTKTIVVSATLSTVWDALTDITQMQQWMSDKEIRITTDWKPGSSFLIEGELSSVPFQNTGMVIDYKKERSVSYSHLSSLSNLPPSIANFTLLEFVLTPKGNQIEVVFTAWNFPTESIYSHFAFYWNVTLEQLKKFIEHR